MSHSSTIGQKYDADGNRRPWWSEDSERAFQDRTECFEKQYSNYTLDGKQVNYIYSYLIKLFITY